VHRARGRGSPIYLSDWIYWFTLLDTDLSRVEAIVQVEGAWLHFARPSQVVQTSDASRVGYTIRAVEEMTLRGESSAVGFLTYEAGAAFGFQVHVSSDLPLAWFAVSTSAVTSRQLVTVVSKRTRIVTSLPESHADAERGRIRGGIQPHQGMHRRRRDLPGELHISPRRNLFGQSAAALRRPRRLSRRAVFGVHPNGRPRDLLRIAGAVLPARRSGADGAPDERHAPRGRTLAEIISAGIDCSPRRRSAPRT
jgi:hypothetical protein